MHEELGLVLLSLASDLLDFVLLMLIDDYRRGPFIGLLHSESRGVVLLQPGLVKDWVPLPRGQHLQLIHTWTLLLQDLVWAMPVTACPFFPLLQSFL
jgi:hypothetical protein